MENPLIECQNDECSQIFSLDHGRKCKNCGRSYCEYCSHELIMEYGHDDTPSRCDQCMKFRYARITHQIEQRERDIEKLKWLIQNAAERNTLRYTTRNTYRIEQWEREIEQIEREIKKLQANLQYADLISMISEKIPPVVDYSSCVASNKLLFNKSIAEIAKMCKSEHRPLKICRICKGSYSEKMSSIVCHTCFKEMCIDCAITSARKYGWSDNCPAHCNQCQVTCYACSRNICLMHRNRW